ncbi:natriuretic peptides B [Centroberyx affinis]|uniref:natriuretic peptides B n=1 Tax=Centroberyx affinis TaxID=166261 RepID=UPI003A5BF25C
MSCCSTLRNMHLSSIPLYSLLLLLNLQHLSGYPINSNGLTDDDVDILKVLLHRLEESIPEQTEVDQRVPAERERLPNLNMEENAEAEQPQTGLDEATIREFFSAKNLKAVRNDNSRKNSGCFGRRMDRIGSMSSLGCNTVGRYSKLQRYSDSSTVSQWFSTWGPRTTRGP